MPTFAGCVGLRSVEVISVLLDRWTGAFVTDERGGNG